MKDSLLIIFKIITVPFKGIWILTKTLDKSYRAFSDMTQQKPTNSSPNLRQQSQRNNTEGIGEINHNKEDSNRMKF